MKKLLPLITSLLLLGACSERPEYPILFSGTLYTDSTITTPVANDTVWFCDFVSRYDDSTRTGKYLGRAYTDSLGRFGFLFWNFDVTQPQYENRKNIYHSFLVLYRQDTLFQGCYRSDSEYKKLVLFPGRQWKIQL